MVMVGFVVVGGGEPRCGLRESWRNPVDGRISLGHETVVKVCRSPAAAGGPPGGGQRIERGR